MKRALVLFALGFGLLPLNGCGSDDDSSSGDPIAQCKEAAAAVCAKFFGGCLTDEEEAAVAAFIGNNEADCRTKFSAECTTEGTKCDSGEKYDSAAGRECISQIKSLSCEEALADGAEPAACDQLCK